MDPSNDFSYLSATAAVLTEHYFLHTFVHFYCFLTTIVCLWVCIFVSCFYERKLNE